jgi:hypothetical protein
MNKMRERGGKSATATLAWIARMPRQSVRQLRPRHQEQLRISAHAHGIKSLMRKYFLEKQKVSDTKKSGVLPNIQSYQSYIIPLNKYF